MPSQSSVSNKRLALIGVCVLAVGIGLGRWFPVPKISILGPLERAAEAIVYISSDISSGSGVIVSADGVIATSLHVIANSGDLSVEMPDGQRYDRVDVIDFDVERDLATLKIVASGLPSVTLAESSDQQRGTPVFAIANPEGFMGSVSAGVLSAIRVEDDGVQYLQTDAAISPGSSGGGLFRADGSLIGILASYNIFGQNLNFAMPVESLRPLLHDEVKYFEEEFKALDPSIFASSEQKPTSDSMAKLMGILDSYNQFYDPVVYVVVDSTLGIFADGTTWDVEFYDELALMCLPLDAAGPIPTEHYAYMLRMSPELDFGYLTVNSDVTEMCYEIPLSGLNVHVFASIFRAAVNGVSLLRDDPLLGRYVPERIDSGLIGLESE